MATTIRERIAQLPKTQTVQCATIDDVEACIKAAQTRGPFALPMLIGPEVASYLLSGGRNDDNRSISPTSQAKLVKDIESGRWELNGQPVILSRAGLLNDGQNRLKAIIDTETPVWIMIAFGLSRESRLTLDIGKKRTTADHIAMIGGKMGGRQIAAGKMLWRMEEYYSRQTSGKKLTAFHQASGTPITDTEARNYVMEHAELIAWAFDILGETTTDIGAMSRVAALMCYLRKRGAPEAEVAAFGRRFAKGVNIEDDAPEYIARERIKREVQAKRARIANVVLELGMKAWNASWTGVKVNSFRVSGTLPRAEV